MIREAATLGDRGNAVLNLWEKQHKGIRGSTARAIGREVHLQQDGLHVLLDHNVETVDGAGADALPSRPELLGATREELAHHLVHATLSRSRKQQTNNNRSETL